MVKKIILLLILVSIQILAYSQYFTTGQNPASIKWKQIDTKHFQIIFPTEAEYKARYLAVIFDDLIEKEGKDLNHSPKKISVVLNTHSATTNGMVAWAPKRMELFTTSSQDNDAQLWLNHLATHEYRHVIQMEKIEQGFTRILNYILGQQATAVVVGLYIPPWFLEGDAVCMETALSESGRGRMPSFEQELRAQLLEKGVFSYDKAVNGSYANFVTNRYKLGYYLVGKARINYGDRLWNSALNKVGKEPYGITSFERGIRDITNMYRANHIKNLSEQQDDVENSKNVVYRVNWDSIAHKNAHYDEKLTLYFDTMDELLWEWKNSDAATPKSAFKIESRAVEVYTNKRFPNIDENGDVIYLKQGLSDALTFEKQNKNGEVIKLFTPGYLSNIAFDYKNHQLLWAENQPDIRWEKGDKSILVCYNVKSKNRSVIKTKNSLFAPSFNGEANKIVAVESDRKGDNSLVILDAKTGLINSRSPCKKNEYVLTPKFVDENNIVLVLLNEEGKHLVLLNLKNGNRKTLFDSGFQDISYPIHWKNYILFNATFTGIDNLFALDLNTDEVFQLTSSRFGARDPFMASNQRLYYADYSSDGYRLVSTILDPSKWRKWNGEVHHYPLAEKLSAQANEKLQVDTNKMEQFKVKKYSKLRHLFNIHSWAPVFIDGIDSKADIGVSMASQNKLGSMLATVGYTREQGYDHGQFYTNLSYRGWFPIIDSKLTIGSRNSDYVTTEERLQPIQNDTLLVNTSWKQWNWENSISLPFNISKGQYTRKIIPKISYQIAQFYNLNTQALATTVNNPLGLGEYHFKDENFTSEILEYQIFGYNIAKTAPRDIQYQWAQIVEMVYRNTPFGDRNLGSTWSAEAYLYFPGFVKHHGLKFYGGYQYHSKNNYQYSNTIKSPRGMFDLYGKEIASLGVDYALPLCYPDWNMGALTYFKRIKLDAFADFGYEDRRVETDNGILRRQNQYFSGGIELRTDMHVLRFPAPVDLGVRIGYENQTNNLFANLLLSFSLSGY